MCRKAAKEVTYVQKITVGLIAAMTSCRKYTSGIYLESEFWASFAVYEAVNNITASAPGGEILVMFIIYIYHVSPCIRQIICKATRVSTRPSCDGSVPRLVLQDPQRDPMHRLLQQAQWRCCRNSGFAMAASNRLGTRTVIAMEKSLSTRRRRNMTTRRKRTTIETLDGGSGAKEYGS